MTGAHEDGNRPGAESSRPGTTRSPSRPSHSPARSRLGVAVLIAGLLLVAFNLRPGVASIGPVMTDIREDLGISASVASLLTTIPVFAFGFFAFFTPALSRRLGMHRLLGVVMLVLALGIGLRLATGLAWLFLGTVLVGAAIAVGNVIMPAAVKTDFPRHTGLMTGLYTTALALGATCAAGLTAPMVPLLDGSWRLALAVWAIPAVAAFVLIIPQMLRTPERPQAAKIQALPDVDVDAPSTAASPEQAGSGTGARGTAPGRPTLSALVRDPVAILVTVFMGSQSLAYYTTLTWVPTLFQDEGMDQAHAGGMMAYAAFLGIFASLFTPAVAGRIRPTWIPVAVMVAASGIAYVGLAVAPLAGAYVWMTFLGLAQGAAISMALTYIAWRSPDAAHTGYLSTLAQGTGYMFAGLGPLIAGLLYSVSGGWAVPLAVLGMFLVVQLVGGIGASRERHVLARATTRR